MLEKLSTCTTNFKNFIFEGSHSIYEILLKTLEKQNEIIDNSNNIESTIKNNYVALDNKKENKNDITNKRKLSPMGVFTGWLNNRSVFQVLTDINDSLSLSQTLIGMVNNRVSIGTIYDGGYFIETEPPTISIEGGLF